MANENLKQIGQGLGGLFRQAVAGTKKAAQRAVAAVEQHASAEGLKKIKDGAQHKLEQAQTYVRQHGGLVNVIESAVERATESVEPFFDRVNKRYEQFEKEYFPNGKLDSEKAKAALKDRAEIVRKFGSRAADSLAEIARKEMVSYRDQYPDAAERQRLYPEVGKAYLGVLSKKDCEDCLLFHKKMQTAAGTSNYFSDVLNDIKPYAIKTGDELLEFYRGKDNMEGLAIARKLTNLK